MWMTWLETILMMVATVAMVRAVMDRRETLAGDGGSNDGRPWWLATATLRRCRATTRGQPMIQRKL